MIDTAILDPIAIFLLDTTIKTTLFIGLVLLAVWLLGTRQSAKRSLLLNWCLIGILVIPIASLCMPSLQFQFDSPSPPSEPAIPTTQPVVAPETPLAKSTPELQQQRVYSVSGVVSLKEDSIEGLEIRAFPVERSNDLTYPKTDHTDANGVYRLDDLEPGEYRILVSLLKEKEIDGRTKTIYYPVQSQTLIIEDRDITRNFDVSSDVYSVSGVVSLNDGSVDGLKIMAFSAKRSSGRIFPKTDRTDTNGAYRLDYLEPGEYRILMSAPEPEEVEIDGHTMAIHHSGQSRTVVIEDRDVTLNFEPLGDARITGVATHNGQPVSGVYVSIHILSEDPENFVSLSGTETDKEGRFGLRDLPSARIAIRFRKTDHLGSGRKHWSKVDTIDLTDKKELNYMAELEMEERTTLSLGDMAPEFEVKRVDGSTFRLADYRGKKAVLIDFWATWCGPCIDEIPTIKRIAETYRDQGLEVVGVSLDRDEQTLRNFVQKEKLSYVQVFDKEKARAISKSYGVWGIPSAFLVNQKASSTRRICAETALKLP